MSLPKLTTSRGIVRYHSENVAVPKFYRRTVTKWITAVAAKHERKLGEINYIFCDDIRILEVNREFLKHDYYTDVITFDYSEDDTISGDVYISVDTVRTNAEEYGVSFEQELRRVMIHAVLHLCGFEDQTKEESAAMRKLEDWALSIF